MIYTGDKKYVKRELQHYMGGVYDSMDDITFTHNQNALRGQWVVFWLTRMFWEGCSEYKAACVLLRAIKIYRLNKDENGVKIIEPLFGLRVPNEYRLRSGAMCTDETAGNNGGFIVPHPKVSNYYFFVIASDGGMWEHISVQVFPKGKKANRNPTWDEMCYIKSLFWDKDCAVVQYHPSEKEYVNIHPFVLHLWRPVHLELPKPPKQFV